MVPVGSSYLTVPNRARAPAAGAGACPAVVWLTGEHDISTDDALSRVLARAIALDATELVIDLSELEFMGASTLGTIVRAREYLRRRSGSLTVRSAPPMARRIIDICGLNDLLGPSTDDAGRPSGGALGSWVAVPVAAPSQGRPGPTAELIRDPALSGARAVQGSQATAKGQTENWPAPRPYPAGQRATTGLHRSANLAQHE
jgi:anti-anti-sigma factor